MIKRAFDVVAAGLGLMLLAPLFVAISIVIRLDSPGPVFFRQERVGRDGRLFRIHKFRTMQLSGERSGPQITAGTDARITRAGSFLRRYKLDELPQLLDVMVGDMSLVGPRPEVPQYVASYAPEVRKLVLSVRPGITDPASIAFRNESELLAASKDPESEYVQRILPAKLALSERYVREQSFFVDCAILLRTVLTIFR